MTPEVDVDACGWSTSSSHWLGAAASREFLQVLSVVVQAHMQCQNEGHPRLHLGLQTRKAERQLWVPVILPRLGLSLQAHICFSLSHFRCSFYAQLTALLTYSLSLPNAEAKQSSIDFTSSCPWFLVSVFSLVLQPYFSWSFLLWLSHNCKESHLSNKFLFPYYQVILLP